jgi:hypothetical protein
MYYSNRNLTSDLAASLASPMPDDIYNELVSTQKIMRPLTASFHTINQDAAQLYGTYNPNYSATSAAVAPSSARSATPSLVGPAAPSSNRPAASSSVTRTTNCKNLKTGQPLYDEKTTICFYNSGEPYFELTNLYRRPITVGGLEYPASENYFQSQKFLPANPALADQIRKYPSPRKAYEVAKNNNSLTRADWHTGYKDTVMLEALKAKFTQHNDLRQLLIDTGDKILVEHTVNDDYWGDGGDGTGKNNLGKLLMRVRFMIKNGQLGGNNDSINYLQKYLKYKSKYNKLKETKRK